MIMNCQYLLSFDLRNELSTVALCSIEHPEERASIIKELPSAIIIDEDDYVEIGTRALSLKDITGYQYKCLYDLFGEPRDFEGDKEMGIMQFIQTLYECVQRENYQILNETNEIVCFFAPESWKDKGKEIWKKMIRRAIPENVQIVILPEQRLRHYANSNRAIALGEIVRADNLTKDEYGNIPEYFQTSRDKIVKKIEEYHNELLSNTIRSVKDICKNFRDEDIESFSLSRLDCQVYNSIDENVKAQRLEFQKHIQDVIEELRSKVVYLGNFYHYTGQIKNTSVAIDSVPYIIPSLEIRNLLDKCSSFIYYKVKGSWFFNENSDKLDRVLKMELDQKKRKDVINNVFCVVERDKKTKYKVDSNIFEIIEESFLDSYNKFKNNTLSQVDKLISEYLSLLKVITIHC